MSLNMAVCALLRVIVREVVVVHKALDCCWPVLVRQTRLVKKAPRTLDNGAVRSLDGAIGVRTVRIGGVVADSKFPAHGV